jgi:predicted NACHT family NTPase
MDQDYSVIFDIVKKKGWGTAKILVIGDPGSGKTMSLKTINKGA